MQYYFSAVGIITVKYVTAVNSACFCVLIFDVLKNSRLIVPCIPYRFYDTLFFLIIFSRFIRKSERKRIGVICLYKEILIERSEKRSYRIAVFCRINCTRLNICRFRRSTQRFSYGRDHITYRCPDNSDSHHSRHNSRSYSFKLHTLFPPELSAYINRHCTPLRTSPFLPYYFCIAFLNGLRNIPQKPLHA